MVSETKIEPQSIIITKGLPYGNFMKHIIFQMTENGQMNKILMKWTLPKPDCNPIQDEGSPLSLRKLISLFIISMIGIFIATILLIIEKIFHAYKPRNHVSVKNQRSKIPRPRSCPDLTTSD